MDILHIHHGVYTAYAPWRTCHAYVELHMQSNIAILGPCTPQTLVTKQLLGNVFKTFRNGWILVEMLSFLLVVFRFFLMEFQLVFIHENQQLKQT